MNRHLYLTATAVTVLLAGCVVTDVTMLDPSRTLPHTEDVAVLPQEPARTYEVIGVIKEAGLLTGEEMRYAIQSDVMLAIQKAAQHMGAHAVLPLHMEDRAITPAYAAYPAAGLQRTDAPHEIRLTIEAAAIRYTEPANGRNAFSQSVQ
jgi:hypothetical protein